MEAEKGDSREGEGESPERHEALHTHARTHAGRHSGAPAQALCTPIVVTVAQELS